MQANGLTRAGRKPKGIWARFFESRRAAAGLVILLLLALVTVIGPVLIPYGYADQQLMQRLQAPSAAHWFGTDHLGRDVLSRSVAAGMVSLPIGLVSMAVSMVLGVLVGTLAGFLGGAVDGILMRITDLFMAFPTFFLLVAMAAMFGKTITVLILIIGITSWGPTARIVRSQVLALREEVFVLAAHSTGAASARIIVRHIIPNVVPTIIVTATLRVGIGILIEGGLSFLGLGVQPPAPSWGNMLTEGRDTIRQAWWMSVFPGALLFLCVMSFNLVGDGLRDAFDPRLRNR